MSWQILQGHVLTEMEKFPDESVHCVVTSPPYWGLRNYKTELQVWPDGWHGELGLEPTPELYVQHLVEVFREVKRVLRKDGTLWLNMGDCYGGGGFGTSPHGDEDFAKRYPKQASNKGSASHETRLLLGSFKKSHPNPDSFRQVAEELTVTIGSFLMLKGMLSEKPLVTVLKQRI